MSARTPTPEERRWIKQWRLAGPALARIKRQELRAMTDAQALRASNRVLSLASYLPRSPRRRSTSGLIQQQALFRRQAQR